MHHIGFKLAPHILSLRSAPQWRHVTFPDLLHRSKDAANYFWQTPANWDLTDDFSKCSLCGTLNHAEHSTLRDLSGFAEIFCTGCKNATRSKRWHCSCDIRWHLCDTHALLLPQFV